MSRYVRRTATDEEWVDEFNKSEGRRPKKHRDHNEQMRKWNAERRRIAEERRAAADDTGIMRRLGPRNEKRPDRPLPAVAMVLQHMIDGRWYGRPHIATVLPDRPETLYECYRKGYVRRAENPNHDPKARGGFDGPRVPGVWGGGISLPRTLEQRLRYMRWVYQITDKGRDALEAFKRKYGVV